MRRIEDQGTDLRDSQLLMICLLFDNLMTLNTLTLHLVMLESRKYLNICTAC